MFLKERVIVKSSGSDNLQNTVEQLQIEIAHLKNEKNRCHILEHILRYGEISPMSGIIHDFKSMSDFYMRQLVKEIEIYRSSADERSQLIDFVNYLHSITHEIEDILVVER